MRRMFLLSAMVVGLASPYAAAEGDAAKGQELFGQCRACHSLSEGQNQIGPHLAGVFGREAGSVPGYVYSAAMKDSGIVWDEESLDSYLARPADFVPGNKMGLVFSRGVPVAQDRADLIAFLRQATGG